MSDRPSGGDMTAAFTDALSSAPSTPAADTSPVSIPTTDPTPAETSPAAAIAQPAATEPLPVPVSDDPQKPPGAPPEWRWQDIKESLRKKTADETEARVRQEIEQQYAWARAIQPDERDGLMTWRAALAGDPQAVAFIRGNPQFLAALRGLTAEQQQAAADTMPEADLQTADGTQVYSASQLQKWQEWNARQMKAQFAQEFKPLADVSKKIQQREDAEKQQQVMQQWASGVLAPLKRLPYYDEFKTDISKAINAPENAGKDLSEVVWDAYAALHKAKLDTSAKTSEATTLANLQQRAVAATVNPNAPNASTPKKFRPGVDGFKEALAHHATGS